MVNVRQPRDVAQILLSVLFLAIMIVACLWIVQPFILGFAWAGTVVIATWPVLLRLQKIMFGGRIPDHRRSRSGRLPRESRPPPGAFSRHRQA